MTKPLNQSHLLYLSSQSLDLPALVTSQIGQISCIISKPKSRFNFFSNIRFNFKIRNLHATQPIDALIIDHPRYLSDGLRSFVKKFNLPVIANALNFPFTQSLITKQHISGFLLPTCLSGDYPYSFSESHSAVVPINLAKTEYWKMTSYKSNILQLAVIGLNPDPSQQIKLMAALDVVKSLNPDLSVDLIIPTDANPAPLLDRIYKSHLVINLATDPVYLETTALAVAAGIPVISPKRDIHQFIPPKSFPGYIVSDWQIDTLSTIIQNSLTHPEETYRVAKNSQHWLKTNLGSTFLPLAWVNAVNQLLHASSQTTQSSFSNLSPN